jgi:methylated-DNA-protein-cysteine methyltransferase related protein
MSQPEQNFKLTKNLPNQVYSLVKSIPPGKITSYGRIANQVGTTARIVGFIMTSLSTKDAAEKDIPWHRVVDRNGFISSSKLEGPKGALQKGMLEAEGVQIEGFQILEPDKYWSH